MHPPLYFWLLHLWALLVGIHLWTGPLLNLLINVATALLLHKLARRVFTGALAPAVVVSLWFLSPSVIETSLWARQYSLWTLLTVLLAWRTMILADPQRPARFRDLLVWTLALTAGALTHFHFAFSAAGCLLWLTFRLFASHRRRLRRILTGSAIALLAFLAVHPEFHMSFGYMHRGMPVFSWGELGERLARVTIALAPYRMKGVFTHFAHTTSLALIASGLTLALSALWVFGSYKRNLPSLERLRRIDDPLFFVVGLFVWLSGAVVVTYLLFLSPFHAIGGRYLAVSWPFVVFIPVLVMRRVPRRTGTVASVLCLLMAASAFLYVNAESRYDRQGRLALSDMPKVFTAPSILMDEVETGFHPRHVQLLPDEKPVYAAQPAFINEHVDLWIGRLEPGSLYVSCQSDINDDVRRARVLETIQQHFAIERLPGRLAGLGDVFRIVRRLPAAPEPDAAFLHSELQ